MSTSLAGFTDFIRNVMGIPADQLPDASPFIPMAYTVACETVLHLLHFVAPAVYDLAVYNFAGDFLINWAQDQPGSTYFADLRKSYGIANFTAGVIQATADETTSESMFIPDFYKDMSLADMQELKTPYGRFYLSIAQKFGQLWGLS